MSTPAIIYIALTAMGFGVCVMRHGQPKTGKHDLGANIFASCITYGLLYWGGFFS
jgi:hypothetical protein